MMHNGVILTDNLRKLSENRFTQNKLTKKQVNKIWSN